MNKLFKILTALTITSALIACSGADTTPTVETPPVAVVQPPVAIPAPVVFCSKDVTVNCEVRFCHQGVDASGNCNTVQKPALPPLPILNVACDENPLHGCPPNLVTPPPVVVSPPTEEWDCIVGCDTSTGM